MSCELINKKKRFSEEEKEFLKLLVLEKKNIIENKKTDSASVKDKKAAWGEISLIFNAQEGFTRVSIIFYFKNHKEIVKTPKLFLKTRAPIVQNQNQIADVLV